MAPLMHVSQPQASQRRPQISSLNSEQMLGSAQTFNDDHGDFQLLETLANMAHEQYHEVNVLGSSSRRSMISTTKMHGWTGADALEGWDVGGHSQGTATAAFASLNDDLIVHPHLLGAPDFHPPQHQQQYTMQNQQHHGHHAPYYAPSSASTTASASTSSDNSPLTSYHPLYPPPHQASEGAGPSQPYAPYQENNFPSPYTHTNDPYTHTHTFTSQSPNTDSAYETLQQQEAELKRLRNTAASARFRAKKKKREASLERNAREKREQLERLEERIAQLEKENSWLRELILRKGERIGREERSEEERKDGVGTSE